MTERRRWTIAIGTSALTTGFLALFTRLPQVADEQLALPIARAVADPALYSGLDLVITSGLRGPFFLYRAASVLYASGANVDLWWLALLIVMLVALFAAVWWLAESITRSSTLASVATAIVAASSPYRGTLHWTLLPPTNLITSTFVTPLVIGAVALAVRGRRGPGLILAALAFNLHPAIGAIAAFGIGAVMLFDRSAMSWRTLLGWYAAAVACALPGAAYVALTSPANFSATAVPSALTFAEQFRLYAYHAFVQDHWREQYGWFVLQLAALALLRAYLPADIRRTLTLLIGALLCLMAVYALNLYTLSYPALNLTFLWRASVFVKPVAFAGLAAALLAWRADRRSAVRTVVVALWGVAALHKNLDIGEGLAAMGMATLLWQGAPVPMAPLVRRLVAVALSITGAGEILAQGWSVVHVARASNHAMDLWRLGVLGAATAATLVIARSWFLSRREAPANADSSPLAPARTAGPAVPSNPANPANPAIAVAPVATVVVDGVAAPSATIRSLALVVVVLVSTIVMRGQLRSMRPATWNTIRQRAQLATPPEEARAVTAWAAGTPPGSLFLLPPTDAAFGTFRLAAGRGVYIQEGDVNQLAYDRANYGEAHRRMLAAGVRVFGSHRVDAGAYDTLDSAAVATLAGEGVTFAIFPSRSRAARPLPFPVAFEDSRWIAYALRPAR